MLVLSPHYNARYFLDDYQALCFILLRYSATTVMQGMFYIEVFFGVTPAWVWCCDASNTFTEHENHQTSGEHNKRQCPDHRQTFAANSCVCVFFFPFILDVKFVGSTGQGHRISHPRSFCGACLYFSRMRDSAVAFPCRP